MGKFFGLIILLIGAVWLIEYYAKVNLPIVAIALIIIGLYLLIKPCCWHEDKKRR